MLWYDQYFQVKHNTNSYKCKKNLTLNIFNAKIKCFFILIFITFYLI